MKTTRTCLYLTLAMLLVALVSAGCSSPKASAQQGEQNTVAAEAATVEFKLVTAVADGHLAFVGSGGEIDGVVNPDLEVNEGAIVRITLENGDGMGHDLAIPDFEAATPAVMGVGDTAEIVFEIKSEQAGSYAYYCTFPGHRQAGQEGRLVVSSP